MKRICFLLLTMLLVVTFFPGDKSTQKSTLLENNRKLDKSAIFENYVKIPLAFTENLGQFDPRVKFTTSGIDAKIFFTREGATFLLSRETEESRTRREEFKYAQGEMTVEREFNVNDEHEIEYEYFSFKLLFVGANENPEVIGEDPLPWKNNYLIGNDPSKWRTDVPNYKKVCIKNIYDGIDFVYYGNQSVMKYDFIVHPGADPSDILLRYDLGFTNLSKNALTFNSNGEELTIATPFGNMVEKKPYSYQIIKGHKIELSANYSVVDSESNTFQFIVDSFDPSFPLIIDPELSYSTYLGGSVGGEYGEDIAIDGAGNAYVTGMTSSYDFPTTEGAFDSILNGNNDAFVAKLNASGSRLIYSTYLGGSANDLGHGITIDGAGNAYVTGRTTSNNFPVTEGAFDSILNGYDDAFVAKLNASGSGLLYATYLGGSSGSDGGEDIAIDGAGNAYVTGYMYSNDLPTTEGAFDVSYNGSFDAFVAKLNASGSGLLYATYLGGGNEDYGYGITIDGSGNAYVTGGTLSNNFPVTEGAIDRSYNGSFDAFVAKLNASGSGILYATYLGGSSTDYSYKIVIDSPGNAYVTGNTFSNNFPTTAGAIYESYIGNGDAFVAKLNESGSGLLYATYLGGGNEDYGYGITIDGSGNAYVTGGTLSNNFPVTEDAIDRSYNGGFEDVFVAKLNASGSGLLYSTYLGGNNDFEEHGRGIAIDGVGNAYVTGNTSSNNFPTTAGAIENYIGGISDAFVCKFAFEITQIEITPNELIPESFSLYQNYPNPFNPETTIKFQLPKSSFVTLKIYNILGDEIKTLVYNNIPAGTHSTSWDGTDNYGRQVSSGVYIYMIRTNTGFVKSQKLLLIK